eukprot:Nitzschia sp. Nitz4//scaffold120_size68122//3266//5905//NITZ4_006035-RA/size68122-processed-gene-0.44-mRNA-1//-1//CDS//3329534251//6200//frame0
MSVRFPTNPNAVVDRVVSDYFKAMCWLKRGKPGFSQYLKVSYKTLDKKRLSVGPKSLSYRYQLSENVPKYSIGLLTALMDELSTAACYRVGGPASPGLSVQMQTELVGERTSLDDLKEVDIINHVTKLGKAVSFTKTDYRCAKTDELIAISSHVKFMKLPMPIHWYFTIPWLHHWINHWFVRHRVIPEFPDDKNLFEDVIDSHLKLNETADQAKFEVSPEHLNQAWALHGGCHAMVMEAAAIAFGKKQLDCDNVSLQSIQFENLSPGKAVAVVYFSWKKSKVEDNLPGSIPWAPGGIPVLGHALQYKENPPAFISKTSKEIGSVFRLNMAGKEMVIVTGPEAQRDVAMKPESQLSARQEVANLGFLEMLGNLNVYTGSDLHKGIIKGVWHDHPDEQVKAWMDSLRAALKTQVSMGSNPLNLMTLLRKVFMRAIIVHLISPNFLEGWDYDFLDAFAEFQDQLEEATAKAVVMPRSLALPVCLWPIQRRREKLQNIIEKRLQLVLDPESKNTIGFWLEAVKEKYSNAQIAELIVGLLFATHKNPSIGASQTYLMLHERTNPEVIAVYREESKALISKPTWNSTQNSCHTMKHVALESLRLTAHTLGAVRLAMVDVKVGSYTIPKGSSINLAHVSTHLDSDHWPNPEAFDLTRPDSAYEDDYKFTTFSQGTHKCPGQNTALVMIQCATALLLEEYEVDLPSDIPPIDFERATLAQRAAPVLVSIRPKATKQ